MEKPKKVILLAFPLDNQTAGIHIYTKELVKSLASNSSGLLDFTIVRHKKDDQFKGINQIILPRISWLPGWSSFLMFILIPLLSIKHKADVVIEPAHFGPFNLPSRIKRVTVMHDLTPILFPEFHTFNGSFLQKLFLPRILKRTHLIISNSLNTMSDLQKIYPYTKNKIENIYLGISSKMRSNKNERSLEKYKIRRPYILYLGTIEPRKNLILLLKAFNLLKQENKIEHELVIAGSKGWKSESFYMELDKSIFTSDINLPGFIASDDISALYSQADVFVYPSLYEGFGLPVVEAMACGTKVVIPYNSSLKEIGQDFATFYYDNTEVALSEAIYSAINNKSKNLDRDKLLEKFNWENYGQKFQDAILNLF